MSNGSTREQTTGGWGFVGILALAPLVCCGAPFIIGAFGVVGLTVIGGASLGLIFLGLIVAYGIKRSRRGANACCSTQVNNQSTAEGSA
jgi:hypothetical protein